MAGSDHATLINRHYNVKGDRNQIIRGMLGLFLIATRSSGLFSYRRVKEPGRFIVGLAARCLIVCQMLLLQLINRCLTRSDRELDGLLVPGVASRLFQRRT